MSQTETAAAEPEWTPERIAELRGAAQACVNTLQKVREVESGIGAGEWSPALDVALDADFSALATLRENFPPAVLLSLLDALEEARLRLDVCKSAFEAEVQRGKGRW